MKKNSEKTNEQQNSFDNPLCFVERLNKTKLQCSEIEMNLFSFVLNEYLKGKDRLNYPLILKDIIAVEKILTIVIEELIKHVPAEKKDDAHRFENSLYVILLVNELMLGKTDNEFIDFTNRLFLIDDKVENHLVLTYLNSRNAIIKKTLAAQSSLLTNDTYEEAMKTAEFIEHHLRKHY